MTPPTPTPEKRLSEERKADLLRTVTAYPNTVMAYEVRALLSELEAKERELAAANAPPKTQPPDRRVTIKLEVGGDTRADAVSMLKHFMRMIEDGSPSCVTGGYDRCGTFTVTERPDVTHDTFCDALDKYLALVADGQARGEEKAGEDEDDRHL